MKITTNIKFKLSNGTCPRTPERTAQGQHKDTNNNDNNILFILFNKYVGNFSFTQSAEEKQKVFTETCMQDKQFKQLTQEQQTQLYTKLISKM